MADKGTSKMALAGLVVVVVAAAVIALKGDELKTVANPAAACEGEANRQARASDAKAHTAKPVGPTVHVNGTVVGERRWFCIWQNGRTSMTID